MIRHVLPHAATLTLAIGILIPDHHATASSSTSRLRLAPTDAKPSETPAVKPADPKPGDAAEPATPARRPVVVKPTAKTSSPFTLRAPDPLTAAALPAEPAETAPTSPRPLGDGTLAVSGFWITQEMLRDEDGAKAKYRGKPLQFQGEIDYRQVDANGVALGFTVNIPMVGYRRFACHSYEPDSVAASRTVRIGQRVTMAGIYDPDYYSKINRDDFQKGLDVARDGGQAGLAVLGIGTTLNFSDCLVLTGHPNGALARALMAARAQVSAAKPAQ
ncbi:MAG: hypothetical protein L6R19_28330 [Alphaproteobacteria bacterium]|nr:hypothetical protein [Alphaproteobacteria bacterium]